MLTVEILIEEALPFSPNRKTLGVMGLQKCGVRELSVLIYR